MSDYRFSQHLPVFATFFLSCSLTSCFPNFLRPGGNRAYFVQSQGFPPTFSSRYPFTQHLPVSARFPPTCPTLSRSPNVLRSGGYREGVHFVQSRGIPSTFLSRQPFLQHLSIFATFSPTCSTLSCFSSVMRPGGNREGAHFVRIQGIPPDALHLRAICPFSQHFPPPARPYVVFLTFRG